MYSESCQTPKMEHLPKRVNGYRLLTIFSKYSVFDLWQDSKYASVLQYLAIVITSIHYIFDFCFIVKYVGTEILRGKGVNMILKIVAYKSYIYQLKLLTGNGLNQI